jgi:hypothetical protein
VILKGEVLEIRNVDGGLHIARKQRHPDEWDPPVALWPGHRRNDVADYPFSPTSDLPHQWVGNSATGKSAAERRGRSPDSGW